MSDLLKEFADSIPVFLLRNPDFIEKSLNEVENKLLSSDDSEWLFEPIDESFNFGDINGHPISLNYLRPDLNPSAIFLLKNELVRLDNLRLSIVSSRYGNLRKLITERLTFKGDVQGQPVKPKWSERK